MVYFAFTFKNSQGAAFYGPYPTRTPEEVQAMEADRRSLMKHQQPAEVHMLDFTPDKGLQTHQIRY